MEHMVMVIPKNANVGEAERVGKEHRQDGPERGKIGALWYFHFQHHDRDDDGNHSIRERLKPLLTHIVPYFLLESPPAIGAIATVINGICKLDSCSSARESLQQIAVARIARLRAHFYTRH